MDPVLIGGSVLPQEFERFLTQSRNQYEVTHRQLYYQRDFATTQAAAVPFFNANLATANLSSNIFPYDNAYCIKAFGFSPFFYNQTFDQGAAGTGSLASFTDDIAQLFNLGVFSMTIGTKKQYGPWRMQRLTAGTGWSGAMAAAGAEAANLVNGALMPGGSSPDSIYKLAMPLVIPANTSCTMNVSFPGGAISIQATRQLTLYLEGFEIAPA